MAAIDVQNLRRSFGKSEVLSDVSLRVEPGSIYGLVGLNGAGKTTLIRVLLGLLRKGGGSVSVGGFDPWRHEPAYYRSVGVALESDGFCANLGVRENLRLFAEAKGVALSEAERYFEERFGGTEIAASPRQVKYLSRGQRAQCGLARAFLGWPSVYFFDEPALSLDVLAYGHFKEMAREAKARGGAVLISSHQLETIDDLCDRVGILRDGVISELDNGKNQAVWMIRTGGGDDWREIIGVCGGEGVHARENVWTFSVGGGEEAIPAIINSLVGAGCEIYEVRRVGNGFSDAIRDVYRGDGHR